MTTTNGRRRAVLFVASRSVHQGLLFVTSIVVARELGPADRARYALPLAAAGVVWGLTHLSLDSAAGRLLARREVDLRVLCRTLTAGVVVLALIGTPIALGAGLLARDTVLAGADSTTVVLAAMTIPPLLAQQMLDGILLRLGSVQVCGWGGAAGAGVILAGATLLATLGRITPSSVMALNLAGTLLSAIVLAVALGRREGWGSMHPVLDRGMFATLVRTGLALHPGTIALQLGTRIDLLIVGAFVSARDAGLYSLATTLAATAIAVSLTLSQLALRGQTDMDAEQGAQYTASFTTRVTGVAALMCTGACLVSYPLVLLAYGSAWTPAVPALVILTAGTLALAIESPLRTFVFRVGRPEVVSALAVGALVANVVITIATVQLLGIAGAAAASVVVFWAYALAIRRVFVDLTQTRVALSPSALWRARRRQSDP